MSNLKKVLAAAVALVASVAVAAPGASNASTGSCEMWRDTALSVGLTNAQFDRLSPLIGRESGCQPTAINHRSQDYGLVQVHYSLWGKVCHMSRSDLLNPSNNLACAKVIIEKQGFGAWTVHPRARRHR